MGTWAGTYSDADFYQNLAQPVTVVHDGGLVYNGLSSEHTKVATAYANKPTGYFSSKSKCTLRPGVLPGNWKIPVVVWESFCHRDTYKELSLIDLVGTVTLGGTAKDQLCSSLTDRAGNPRLPLVCGGTDPDIDNYNPNVNAGEEISGTIGALQTEAEQTAEEIILQTRKKIFGIGFIILLLVVIGYILIKQ